MLWAVPNGGLELRRSGDGATHLRGRFGYGAVTVLWDGGKTGRAHKERFAPRAFSPRVLDPEADIHLLVAHDYDRPLASRAAGTLSVEDSEDALIFEAQIGPELRAASYVADVLAGLSAGLIRGLSPGFRIAPERGAEDVRAEDGALIRTVRRAELQELSIVTRPAYPRAQVEARSWEARPAPDSVSALRRWRA